MTNHPSAKQQQANDNVTSRIAKRKTHFELLRVLAMLMIVSHHFAVHGVQHVLSADIAYCAWNCGSAFNRIVTSLLIPGGSVGIALFFMLTGYFLVKKQKPSVLKVCLQTIYYGLCLSIAVILLVVLHETTGIGWGFPELTLAKKATTVFQFALVPISTCWWFVSAYVLLVLAAPRINLLLANLNKTGFLCLLAVTWFFWYNCQIGFHGAYYTLGKAFFFYLLGAYQRLHCDKKTRKWPFLAIAAGCWCAFATLSYFFDGMAARGTGSSVGILIHLMVGVAQKSFFAPFCAWCIFSLFARLEMPPNRFVNAVAATTFGIYLLHDSSVGRSLIWNGCFKISDVQYMSPFFPVFALADILCVFTLCSVADFVRLRFVEPKMLAKANAWLARGKECFFTH